MPKKGLYIQMFSIHGLLRAHNLEMGRDADTGGQIKYVVELANHLSCHEDIGKIDLFTRLIVDKTVSKDYGNPIEEVNDKFRIIRIQCGGRKYLRKELLWPHLAEYIDKTIKFIKQQGLIPDICHGHYADAGFIAMHLAEIFGVPFIFTGHSLGRAKYEKLLGEGMKPEDIHKKYKIETRIKNEENILSHADLVVTSTTQEIKGQYGIYKNNSIPKFRVIPPGIDIEKFYPYYHDMMPESSKEELEIHAHASVLQEMNRFFSNTEKPIILALCRPDRRKNISGLVKAFGEDLELQAMANLAVYAGIRKNIADKEENERSVLTDMLLLMDRYDLYGKMAIPKRHDFELEVPELYRIIGEKSGIFVNAALTEPFGLTLLEASACGVPIIATQDGGPQDIMKNCENGILVDPSNTTQIQKAAKKLLSDKTFWEEKSKNGIVNIRKHYTWEAHTKSYIAEIQKIPSSESTFVANTLLPNIIIGKRLARIKYFFFTDIDHTLIGEDNAELQELLTVLTENRHNLGFGVATGRTIDSAMEHLNFHDIIDPDIIISSVGSEIYYGGKRIYDKGWHSHIENSWNREKTVTILRDLPFLKYQEEATQREFKVSYFMEPEKDRLSMIHDILSKHKLRANIIYSHEHLLDLLPYRASKGKAVRYLSYKWEIPLENICVSGDSGNDEEMLRGEPLGIVVGNYSPELEKLKGLRNIYFASTPCAGGILEGFNHYQLINRINQAGK